MLTSVPPTEQRPAWRRQHVGSRPHRHRPQRDRSSVPVHHSTDGSEQRHGADRQAQAGQALQHIASRQRGALDAARLACLPHLQQSHRRRRVASAGGDVERATQLQQTAAAAGSLDAAPQGQRLARLAEQGGGGRGSTWGGRPRPVRQASHCIK